MTETAITLTLRIRSDGEHIAGVVHDESGGATPFSGRIGLMSVIDTLVCGRPDCAAPPIPLPLEEHE